jgi:hypothetical protein
MMLLQVWSQPLDSALLALGFDLNVAIIAAPHALGLPAPQVTSTSLEPYNLARARSPKTFGRGFVSLYLRHLNSTSQA